MGCASSTGVLSDEASARKSGSKKSGNGSSEDAASKAVPLEPPSSDLSGALAGYDSNPPREFSLEVLRDATDNFAEKNVLGEGGFGKVYRGWLEDDEFDGEGAASEMVDGNRPVAVKLMSQEGIQGFKEWLTEVIYLRQLRHPHLVQLVGYCTDEEAGLLVYEYMPNGSLDNFLFNPNAPALDWEQRLNIAIGAARGLQFLHSGTRRQVIFRDFKTGNILLDKDYNAKLSDFGLARDGPSGANTHVSTKVVGTYGYTAPEYMQTGHLTAKSDVYAFGVVLLELLSGRRAVDLRRPQSERNLVTWAKPYLSDRKIFPEMLDPRLKAENLGNRFPMKAAQKLSIAASCCLLDAKSRPTMSDMVKTLETLQEFSWKQLNQNQADS